MDILIKEALREADADYLDIRVEEETRTEVLYAGKELETAKTSIDRGGAIRAYYQGGWGFVCFNDLDNLKVHVRTACAQARLVGGKGGSLHPVPSVVRKVTTQPDIDPLQVPLQDKVALAGEYNRIVLSAPKIQTSQSQYKDSRRKSIFANTEGSFIDQEKVYAGVRFMAIAKEGNNVQRAYESIGDTRGFGTVVGLEERVHRVIKDARDLLRAPKVPGGTYTVILNPLLCGVFIHEAFGHLSESDFLFQNPEFQKTMSLGRRFGPQELSVVDDATLKGQRGYYQYDDEGVAGAKTHLIKDGILTGRLHSRETAGKMNEPVTGNGRALNYRHEPLVRMSCTYVEPGQTSFEEMIAGVDDGIYAVGVLGGNTDLEMFTFTAEKGYRIHKGQVREMVRDVILSGNVFQTLKNIDAIGGDLTLFGSLGGCGKGGQQPLPVSHGGPHLRIQNVLIG
jgi:TldD protein